MNIGVHVSLLKILRFSLNRCPRVRLQDYIIALFLVFEKLHPFLHSGCITLHSTDSVGGLLFIHILSSIYYLLTLMMAILTAVRWNFIVVLICISLTISDFEFFFFICLLAICMSSLEKCLFKICPLFDSFICSFVFALELYELFVYFAD